MVAASGACGGLHLGVGGVGAAVADVLADRAVEQPRVLQNHRELAAQLGAVPVANVHAVDLERARVHVIEALEQLDERGLARARGAHDGHGLAGQGRAGEVVDDRLVRRVAKAHVVELDKAVALLGNDRSCGLGLLGGGEELEDALGGRGHGLQRVTHVAKLLDRLGEVAHVLDEALDVTGGGRASKRELGAHHDDAHVAHVSHERHERHHEAREELGAPAGDEQAVVLLVELGHGGVGAVEDLDDVLAGEVLLDDAVHGTQHLLLLAEVGLREVDHHDHDERGGRQREHGDARERQADGQHHDEHTHDLGDRGDELRDGLVEALAQGVDVVRDAGEHVALAVAVEVAHGNDRDLLGDLLAHAIADLLGDARHEPALDEVARRAREVETQQEQQRLADPVEVDRTRAAHLGDEALVELRGDLAQDLGSHDVEDDGAHGERDAKEHGHLVLADVAKQLSQRALEVLGLLGGAAAHTSHGPTLTPGRRDGLLVCH